MDLWIVGGSMFFGPTPVDEALRRTEALRRELAGNPLAELALLRSVASCYGQLGRFDESRQLTTRVRELLADRGFRMAAARMAYVSGPVELIAGDLVAAERELRRSFDELVAMGETGRSSSIAVLLARALCAQERDDEAEELVRRVPMPDLTSFPAAAVLARVLARRGQLGEAEHVARDAVTTAERTDWLNWHGDVLLDLAEVLRAAGKPDEAHAAVEAALRLYEQKGNVVSAASARAFLEEAGARL
jgi:tetratricopeptide (TPR) repeat protein